MLMKTKAVAEKTGASDLWPVVSRQYQEEQSRGTQEFELRGPKPVVPEPMGGTTPKSGGRAGPSTSYPRQDFPIQVCALGVQGRGNSAGAWPQTIDSAARTSPYRLSAEASGKVRQTPSEDHPAFNNHVGGVHSPASVIGGAG